MENDKELQRLIDRKSELIEQMEDLEAKIFFEYLRENDKKGVAYRKSKRFKVGLYKRFLDKGAYLNEDEANEYRRYIDAYENDELR